MTKTGKPEPKKNLLFDFLIRLILNKRFSITFVVLTLSAMVFAYFGAVNLESEDDLLAFLPDDDPDVSAFKDINDEFGSLQVALVGIEADDVLSPGFLARLDRLTKRLKSMGGLSHVLSLTNVVDYVVDDDYGGVVTGPLVSKIPKDEREVEDLRKRILSKESIKGNLVSEDGKSAVVVYCFIAPGTEPRDAAGRIKSQVQKLFPHEAKYWGGAPFISTYIYDTTKQDLSHLTHWAVIVIVLVILVSFRDVIGAFLALAVTGMGILSTLAAMYAAGVKFNVVLGGMPVILFALGSAYSIHLLSRFYMHQRRTSSGEAISRALRGVGPTVFAAGSTTAVSLLSFLMMNIRPLRTFGMFTALGILTNLVLSLTFLPALISLVPIKKRLPSWEVTLRKLTMRLCLSVQRKRRLVAVLSGLVILVGLGFSTKVDTRVEPTTFYSAGSPPDQASRFLRKRFGGDQFLQIEVKGDMEDPMVLRQVQRTADAVSLMPGVTSVMHIGYILASLNEVMSGEKRIPATRDQVRSLYPFVKGDESVARFITNEKDRTLIQAKLDASDPDRVDEVLDEVGGWLESNAVKRFEKASVASSREASKNLYDLVWTRIRAELHLRGISTDKIMESRVMGILASGWPEVPKLEFVSEVEKFLASGENPVSLPDTDGAGECRPQQVARAVIDAGPDAGEAELSKLLSGVCRNSGVDESFAADLAFSLGSVLPDIRRKVRARTLARKIAVVVAGSKASREELESLEKVIASSVLDMDLGSYVVEAGPGKGKALDYRMSGQPVMNRGLSRSAQKNQIKSLLFAFLLVLPIMAWLFRSFVSGLLATLPTMVTLAVVFGGMGALGVHLDIGTAMLASLVLGAGVDYAIHMLSAWRANKDEGLDAAAARAADRTGPGVWTNALMVAAGFFVLTLGQAKPLKNVGGLTCVAMLVAALATFVVLPVLAGRRQYRDLDDPLQEETSDLMKQVMSR